jgi:hypothetical protein
MAQIINLSIDLAKVDKSMIKTVTLKSGKIAKYLNLSCFVNDAQDQYGNICSLSLNQTEEERKAKTPKLYVGNGKRVWAETKPNPDEITNENEDDGLDLPF